jgi:hypothetical protein
MLTAQIPLSASRRNPMICSSVYRFFTSNLLPGLDSKPKCYSNQGGRRDQDEKTTLVSWEVIAHVDK